MADPAFLAICGPDDYLVAREGRRVWEEWSAEVPDDLNREVVNGAAGNGAEVEQAVDRFRAAVRTLPMFGGRKLVWLKDVTFLSDTVTGRAEGTRTQWGRLLELLERIRPEEVGALLTISPVDRRRSEFKWLQEHGEMRLMGGEKEGAAAVLVLEEARALNLRIAPETAEMLALRVGGQTRLAREEMHKLATYLDQPGAEVTEQLVLDLVPVFGEGDFLEPVDPFFARDLPGALAALRRYFFAGHDARPLLTALQNRTRLLIQLRVLVDAGEIGSSISAGSLAKAGEKYGGGFGASPAKSSLNLFTQNPWYLGRLLPAAKALPLRRLIDFQFAFRRAFTELLERPREAEEVLRETFIRCLQAGG